MRSVGITGEDEAFQKPLFQTWGMFLGMTAALFIHCLYSAMTRSATKKKGYEVVGDASPTPVSLQTYLILALPAVFDLVATALCMFGLVYIPVSIYQMLRGGAIVFVALLKHFFLNDKLMGYMWVGVALNVVSIVLVGVVAMVGGGGGGDAASDKNPLVGLFLVLGGAFVQSLQYAFEERVMTSDIGAPPLLVIGMEGFWGLLLCTVALYVGTRPAPAVSPPPTPPPTPPILAHPRPNPTPSHPTPNPTPPHPHPRPTGTP